MNSSVKKPCELIRELQREAAGCCRQEVMLDLLEALGRQLPDDLCTEEKLAVSRGRISCYLSLHEIESISADGRCIVVRNKEGREFYADRRLKDVGAMWGSNMVQISRSCLVPKEGVECLRKTLDGGCEVVMTETGNAYRISRRNVSSVRQALA